MIIQKKVSLTLKVRKTKAKKLTEFLKEIDFVEIQEENEYRIPLERFEVGSFVKGESPLQVAGIWKDNSKRLTAKEIRERAWQRK